MTSVPSHVLPLNTYKLTLSVLPAPFLPFLSASTSPYPSELRRYIQRFEISFYSLACAVRSETGLRGKSAKLVGTGDCPSAPKQALHQCTSAPCTASTLSRLSCSDELEASQTAEALQKHHPIPKPYTSYTPLNHDTLACLHHHRIRVEGSKLVLRP